MERASKTVPLGEIPVENGVVLTTFWHHFDDAIFSCPLEATGIDDRDRGTEHRDYTGKNRDPGRKKNYARAITQNNIDFMELHRSRVF